MRSCRASRGTPLLYGDTYGQVGTSFRLNAASVCLVDDDAIGVVCFFPITRLLDSLAE
jgi:hypothetical protein